MTTLRPELLAELLADDETPEDLLGIGDRLVARLTGRRRDWRSIRSNMSLIPSCRSRRE